MQPWFSEAKVLRSLQAEICFPTKEALYSVPIRFLTHWAVRGW
jgi:hypothetical protein